MFNHDAGLSCTQTVGKNNSFATIAYGEAAQPPESDCRAAPTELGFGARIAKLRSPLSAPTCARVSDGTGHKIEREAERNSRSLVTRNVAGDRFLTRDQDRLLNRTAMATSTRSPVGIPSGRDFSCASPRPRRYLRYCRVLRGGSGYPPIHPESDRWRVRCCTSSTVPDRQGFRRSAAGSCPG